MLELVDILATSVQRCEILEGFLRYRGELSAAGIMNGVQWIDGSFCESLGPAREPNDLDLVTICELPTDPALAAIVQQEVTTRRLIYPAESKIIYRCDGYFVTFPTSPGFFADQIVYWYGLLSHRRGTMEWKGLLAVSLDRSSDPAAATLLAQRKADLGGN